MTLPTPNADAGLEESSKRRGQEQQAIGSREDQWKFQAPYETVKPGQPFNVKYEASCHCGSAKYQISRSEPLASKLCHCTSCQTQHGAPFQWAAIFHKTDTNFLHGHRNLEWYDPSTQTREHNLPCKVRCARCRSPIMDEGRNMVLLFPSLVKFEKEGDRRAWLPKCHIFYRQRVLDMRDSLPKWTGLDGKSDLIGGDPS